MKERGVIFNCDMVRTILSGQKTQTRRIVEPQSFDRSWSRHDHQIEIVSGRAERGDEIDGLLAYTKSSCGTWSTKCSFGQPGDRLCVRETCQAKELETGLDVVCYPADQTEIPVKAEPLDSGNWIDLYRYRNGEGKSVPAIHMPRWTSRITLEITDVRVERLNDISEEDAVAEGFTSTAKLTATGDDCTGLYASDRFAETWQSIYGEASWQANPWCWAIEFRRMEASHA
ncbi:hypothetical protein JMY81_00975 [Brenneria goodwinii]|uniref:Phage-related protein n=1 Tax=Brenneria goodwinii TaxID=1109412 RepID=A0A0G4K173_9GAMM|nr:hypothetical protein [Brenneria goodwinii]MCG8155170.1 hypothetical protein [Brenneria goodwinii]MCG8159414.1 hypothetical protein [Brenneria goodwinii]MCG8164417.1 hypothetical protein [Brenneria goodwinii]MCG8169017.1 hypothetical protein [Brenneria goodwinii]MCG8173273.1 hypothetical protein [Brenneria goodwinii]